MEIQVILKNFGLSEKEIAAVMDSWRSQGEPEYDAIAMRAIQPPDDCSPEPMRCRVLCWRKIGDAKLQLLQDVPGAIGAPIVHDYDLMWHIMLT